MGDWPALRARIAADGYVFIRGLLDPDEVASIGRSGLGHLQSAGWTEGGSDPVTAPPRAPVHAVRMLDAFSDPGYRRILADPEFNRLAFDSPLAGLMGQILGPAGFCYPLKVPRIVYPTSLVPQQPGNVVHKDYRSVQDMFTCWVPLADVPTSLGGLAIETGSHHRLPGAVPTPQVARGRMGDHRLPPGRRAGVPLSDHPRRPPQPVGPHALVGRVPLATGRPARPPPTGHRSPRRRDRISAVRVHPVVAVGDRGAHPVRRRRRGPAIPPSRSASRFVSFTN